MATKNTSTITDGGYYAVKGFTFQFDKTISEVISNKDDLITVEQIQDLSRNNYYIQVKHKEALEYSPSKIRKAVRQLLDDFKDNRDHTYSLYCYFKDRAPSILQLSVDDLDKILGKDKDEYKPTIKRGFVKNFRLEFANDFDEQFKSLIKEIVKAFHLKTDEEAIMHHASFRAELINIAIKKQRSAREINFNTLEDLISHNEKIVFDVAYSKYLTNTKYLAYIKKTFFTHKRVNVSAHERLITICLKGDETNAVLTQAIQNIKNRFYIQDQSPAPFVLISGLDPDRITLLKQELWTTGIKFIDGTNFSGDIFRVLDMQQPIHKISKNSIKLKWVDVENIDAVLKAVKIDTRYVFVCEGSEGNVPSQIDGQKFYVKSANDVIEVTK